MGRSYWFECSRCGYRAAVAGGADRGRDFFVQTIACHDCKRLYDAVVRSRFPAENRVLVHGVSAVPMQKLAGRTRRPAVPPTFMAAMNRLPSTGAKRFTWVHFPLRCPVSGAHRVRPWTEPGKCPKCGIYLDKNALPYRIWD